MKQFPHGSGIERHCSRVLPLTTWSKSTTVRRCVLPCALLFGAAIVSTPQGIGISALHETGKEESNFWSKIVPSESHSVAEYVEKKIRLRLVKYPISEKEIRRIIVGIFANAYHESSWNPNCVSSGNYGLFQLSKSGLGAGKSKGWLLNYKNNTTAILNSPQAIKFFDWAAGSGFTSGDFAYEFAKKVERCAAKHVAPRKRTADKWAKEIGL